MQRILPVFAGMIPFVMLCEDFLIHSPRIRGDDPSPMAITSARFEFSPYSRG